MIGLQPLTAAIRPETPAGVARLDPEPPGSPPRLAERVTAARDTLSVEFFRDHGAGHVVYRLADPVTGETLLQIPGAELLRFFAALKADLGRSPDLVV